MNDTPLVSVIIPTYNRAEILPEAVQSVLNQTYRHMEILVVDDGSTDNSIERLRPLIEGRPVRIIRGQHRGAAAARNLGLSEARGEFIGFCDSDDLWLSEKLKRQVEFLEQHSKFGLVYSDIMSFRGNEIEIPSYFAERKPYSGRVFSRLLERNFIPNVSVLVRKKCLDEIGAFNESFKTSEDYELWLRFSNRFEIGYIPEILVKVRRHAGNITGDDQAGYQNHLAVLDSIARQFPTGISKDAMSHAYANTYQHMGYDHLLRRRFSSARDAFIKSLRWKPMSLNAYRYLAALMLPAAALDRLIEGRVQKIS